MSYAYSYQTNSIDKYASIQSGVADQYAYLDEVDEEQESPLNDFNDEDDEQLAKLYALTWEN